MFLFTLFEDKQQADAQDHSAARAALLRVGTYRATVCRSAYWTELGFIRKQVAIRWH